MDGSGRSKDKEAMEIDRNFNEDVLQKIYLQSFKKFYSDICGKACLKMIENMPNIQHRRDEHGIGSYFRCINRVFNSEELPCKFCSCGYHGRPCQECTEVSYECLGSCFCCEGYRNSIWRSLRKSRVKEGHEFETENRKFTTVKTKVDPFCRLCSCTNRGLTVRCTLCFETKMRCEGDCDCCQKYRRTLHAALASGLHSIALDNQVKLREICICNINPSTCLNCKCVMFGKPCEICRKQNFFCDGSCACCEGFRNDFKSEVILQTSSDESSDPVVIDDFPESLNSEDSLLA